MGFNTTVVILNDALGSIESDTEFGQRIAGAIRRLSVADGPIEVPAGGHCNAAVVVETHHASSPALVCVSHNWGTVVEMAPDRDAIYNEDLAATRETLRLALNETKAYRENLSAAQARCNELLEEARAARAREAATQLALDALIASTAGDILEGE